MNRTDSPSPLLTPALSKTGVKREVHPRGGEGRGEGKQTRVSESLRTERELGTPAKTRTRYECTETPSLKSAIWTAATASWTP